LPETRKLQYLQEKRKYKATLRKAKIQLWKQYCNATTLGNLWNMVYKLAASKMRSCSTLSTIRRHEGTVSSGMAEMLNVMMEHFTPAGREVIDDYHKLGRRMKHQLQPKTNPLRQQKFGTLYTR
jgi:hypothetical protein